jgi:acyl-CoA synthetase (AMP-forming)/AMP-acid ligase II
VFVDEERQLVNWRKVPDIAPCVPALLSYAREHYRGRELLVFDEAHLTYDEADKQSATLARQLLEVGVGKATRVGMMFPNSPQFVIVWLAITRIGAVAVPISTFSSAPEVRALSRHADLALLISTDGFLGHDYVARYEQSFPGVTAQQAPFRLPDAPFLRDIWIWGPHTPPWARGVDLSSSRDVSSALLAAVEAQVTPADQVSIIYTSGSTADPKGVIHTHGSLLHQGAKVAASYPYSGDDRVFTPMPFFWVGGLTLNLLNVMQVGAALLCSSVTRPDALLEFLERQRVTYMMSWPHTARALAADPSFPGRDFSAMRGGALQEALPEHRRLRSGVTFGRALGMTETSGPHTIAHLELPEDLTDSFGTPMPGMELRLIDPSTGEPIDDDDEIGELLVRGDALMQGMVKRERQDIFDSEGWYPTGDLCSFRQRHLFFHGRIDDMIKTAGANVAPGEVEAVLRAIPGVVQVHVTGVRDETRGAVVAAVVVPEPGVHIAVDDVRGVAIQELSSYKVPRTILVIEAGDLPMMSSAKVDRRALLERLEKAHSASAASPGTR